jgi:hypothetical protein
VTPFTTEPMLQLVLGNVAVQVFVVWPAAVAVAVKPLMTAPPLFAGEDQLTGSEAFWFEVTLTPVGASGGVEAVPVAAPDAALLPSAFVAFTVTVYTTPLTIPVSVQLVPAEVQVRVVWPDAVAVTT